MVAGRARRQSRSGNVRRGGVRFQQCSWIGFSGNLTEGGLNLGNESGYSVKQVLASVREVIGKAVPHDVVGRRAGDPAVLVANSALARSALGWRPQYPALGDIVAHAVAWHTAH